MHGSIVQKDSCNFFEYFNVQFNVIKFHWDEKKIYNLIVAFKQLLYKLFVSLRSK